MKKKIYKSLPCLLLGIFCVVGARGASVFSNYGQIQNVQNYSTNPFWTPNSPYNKRAPQPIYAQGPDLETGDCVNLVWAMVSAQCMARNNCRDTQISDIRPTVMVQLSQLPDEHNYVTACAGYIDYMYNKYVETYGTGTTNPTNKKVAFPSDAGTVPNTNVNKTQFPTYNSNEQKPDWKIKMEERAQELYDLQRENGVGSESLSKKNFPLTYADFSLSERRKNNIDGYAPYENNNVYNTIVPQDIEEWCSGNGSETAWCKEYERVKDICTDEAKQLDPLVILAKYNSDHFCEVKKCEPGYVPNSEATGCEEEQNNNNGGGGGENCLAEAQSWGNTNNADKATQAEKDPNGDCKITECNNGNGWRPTSNGKGCEQGQPTPPPSPTPRQACYDTTKADHEDCTQCAVDNMDSETLEAEYKNGSCEIQDCDHGKVPNQTKTKCEVASI